MSTTQHTQLSLLARILNSSAGQAVLNRLDAGQGTETEDGKAWLEAREALASAPTQPDDQEREKFVNWLNGTYPRSHTKGEAEEHWQHGHISALAWKAGREEMVSALAKERASRQAAQIQVADLQARISRAGVEKRSAIYKAVKEALASEQAQPSFADERAAFEAWAKSRYLDPTPVDPGTWGDRIFKHDFIEAMWTAWKARAAIATQAAPQQAEPLHIGACITDGRLHATVMRRESNGDVTVLACAEMPVDKLHKHDCLAEMAPVKKADRYASALLDDATFVPRLISDDPAFSVPPVKAMEWRGVQLVEAPEKSCCGCYFSPEIQGGCTRECGSLQSRGLHIEVFGRDCSTGNVIYVKAKP